MIKTTFLSRQLHIISRQFPFGQKEQFFELEVKHLAQKFDRVIIYPLEKEGAVRTLPENVSVNEALLAVHEKPISKRTVLKEMGWVGKILAFEFRKTKKKQFFLKKMKRWLFSLVNADRLGKALRDQIDPSAENYFYSFWMNEGALALARLKAKSEIHSFSFRVNGYDLFDERQEGGYMPFQRFIFRYVGKVFVPSKAGINVLKEKGFVEKCHYMPHGIHDEGFGVVPDLPPVRIVSCSNVIALKRIDRILSVLRLINEYQIHWTHFGDGPLLDKFKKEELPGHLYVDWRGSVPYSEIQSFYKKEGAHLLIHTSDTEGFGMAILEAQSFGVLVVARAVGGVTDLLSEEMGTLIPEKASDETIADAIRKLLKNKAVDRDHRVKLKEDCLKKFSADQIYNRLFEQICETDR